ncbi:MAG: DUF424 family protein [Candidatus Kariarchaeaceae archaeon]
MSFYLKIYQNGKEKIAAICDKEIKDREFIHNGVKIRVKGDFYGYELFEKEEIMVEIVSCTSINAFGKRICELLVENKIAHQKAILWLKDGSEKVGHVIVIV